MQLITINQIQPDGIYSAEVVAVLLDKQVAAVRRIKDLRVRQANARSYKYVGADIIAYWNSIFGAGKERPRTYRRKQSDHENALKTVSGL